ncbi:MAG TPA: hypothetical protein VF743_06570, partial [Acidimicrobiales bacterium]
ARVEAGMADARGELPERRPIRVRTSRINRLLSTSLDAAAVRDLLEPIGFATAPAGDDLDVTVPSWRYDSSTEIDVVEEVARHHGYTRIGRRVPPSAHTGRLTERQRERRRLRALLVGRGLSEALPLPFLAPGDLERSGLPGDGIELANPLVAEESVLRTSLLPGLVKALSTNAARRNTGVALWEIGHVFRRPEGQAPGEETGLPDEREVLGMAMGGREAHAAVHEWRAVEEVLDLAGVVVRNGPVPGLHPTRSAVLVGPGGEAVGALGEVDPAVLEAHGIAERVAWLEVDLDVATGLPRTGRRYRPVSVYPSSDIDLAFEVDDAVSAAEVADTLRIAAGDRLAAIRLFDVYRGAGIADGRRSLAYTLRLEALDHTLTDDEVAVVRTRAVEAVEATHAATLRG